MVIIMAQQIRPIWQIMAAASQPGGDVTLTCDECFVILDHLAGLALAGAKDRDFKITVRSYLAHCPDCADYYDSRIEEIRAWLDRNKSFGKS